MKPARDAGRKQSKRKKLTPKQKFTLIGTLYRTRNGVTHFAQSIAVLPLAVHGAMEIYADLEAAKELNG